MLQQIEKAIINSDLGLNPQNDGEIIRLNIPPLTEQRRKDLVKQSKNEAENGRISVRNVRKDANIHLKKLLKEHVSEDEVKRAEQTVQDFTDEYIKKIDQLLEKKEEEIMTVWRPGFFHKDESPDPSLAYNIKKCLKSMSTMDFLFITPLN